MPLHALTIASLLALFPQGRAQVPPVVPAPLQAISLDEALESEGLTATAIAEDALAPLPATPEDLMARYPSVEIDGQRYAVVEGDLLLDADELSYREYALRLQVAQQRLDRAAERAGVRGTEARDVSVQLAAESEAGIVVRWRPGKVLTYAVLCNTFPSAAACEAARVGVAQAAQEWEAVCGVDFQHLPDRDGAPNLAASGCTFVVRYMDLGPETVALAFFPSGPRDRRRLLLGPAWFKTSYDQTGVLRHELGHILGFRHEHVRPGAPNLCPDEPLVHLFPLTEYDPHSVMHYFCGSAGTHELKLTDRDILGSRAVYGPPLGQFLFAED